jgi:hypothetical protein
VQIPPGISKAGRPSRGRITSISSRKASISAWSGSDKCGKGGAVAFSSSARLA